MILIVEDETTSRRALRSLLAASGFSTAAVGTAEEALQILEQGEVPDVALVDLDLPGMDGLELIHHMEQRHPSVFPVLITATSKQRLENLTTGEQFAYFRKPLDFPELLALLTRSQRRN
jgi:CheY-like chemotaxis protein